MSADTTDKMTQELAEQEFFGWCAENDIETSGTDFSDTEKQDFDRLKRKVVKAIRSGRCVVDGGNLRYTLSEKSEGNLAGMTVTVTPPNGRTFLSMDGYKDTQGVHKQHAAMSSITGVDVGVFSKIGLEDWKFFQAVLVLFLAD